MGMVLGLVSIDDECLLKTLTDPPLVWKIVAPDEAGFYEDAKRDSVSRSWFSRLFKKEKSIPKIQSNMPPPTEEIDLDKSWNGIHYLLTQTSWEGEWPLNFLVAGGKQIGDIDLGYGPGRAFLSAEVKEINAALSGFDLKMFSERYDPIKMKELDVYPDIWDDRDEGLPYCEEYFGDLRTFVSRTSDADLGLLIYIS